MSVRVDNRMILPYRPDGHSVSDSEGATWNGIVGRIELSATTPVWIEDVQAFPEVEKKAVRLHVVVGNETGKSGEGVVAVGGAGGNSVPVKWDEKGGVADVEVRLWEGAKMWSEFSPFLQRLTVELSGGGAEDSRAVTFGLREIKAVGKKILLNGTELDLRATHDGGGFPLTGYPAMDVASWKRIIGICKEWGLNGMRFHSWCPPEAAFEAADELGFYLQPECGMWNSFDAEGKMLGVLNDETGAVDQGSMGIIRRLFCWRRRMNRQGLTGNSCRRGTRSGGRRMGGGCMRMGRVGRRYRRRGRRMLRIL